MSNLCFALVLNFQCFNRHRWTGRYEAHLWDNTCRREGQTRKGRQGKINGLFMAVFKQHYKNIMPNTVTLAFRKWIYIFQYAEILLLFLWVLPDLMDCFSVYLGKHFYTDEVFVVFVSFVFLHWLSRRYLKLAMFTM